MRAVLLAAVSGIGARLIALQPIPVADVLGGFQRLHDIVFKSGYVIDKQILHMAARVHIVRVCVHYDLEKHHGIVTAGAAVLVVRFDFGDVWPVNDCAGHTYPCNMQHTDGLILGKLIANLLFLVSTGRKNADYPARNERMHNVVYKARTLSGTGSQPLLD